MANWRPSEHGGMTRGGAPDGRCSSSHSGGSSSYSGGSSSSAPSYSAPAPSASRWQPTQHGGMTRGGVPDRRCSSTAHSAPRAPSASTSSRTPDPVVGSQTFSRRAPAPIHEGPRGGHYYITPSGTKEYVSTTASSSSRSAPSRSAPKPTAKPTKKPTSKVTSKPSAKPTKKPASKGPVLTFPRRSPADLKKGPKGGWHYETESGHKEYVQIKYLETARSHPICSSGLDPKRHGDKGQGTEAAHKCSHRVARAVLAQTGGPQTSAATEALCRALNDNCNIRLKSQRGNRALDERRDKRICDIVQNGGTIKENTTAHRAIQCYKGIREAADTHNNLHAKDIATVIGNLMVKIPNHDPIALKDLASQTATTAGTGGTGGEVVSAGGVGGLSLPQVRASLPLSESLSESPLGFSPPQNRERLPEALEDALPSHPPESRLPHIRSVTGRARILSEYTSPRGDLTLTVGEEYEVRALSDRYWFIMVGTAERLVPVSKMEWVEREGERARRDKAREREQTLPADRAAGVGRHRH
ncbi:hypothetical protein KIPB_000375 [Kipferlia bialata]|uniref:SH3 domain-containing protein n=1 Tax=Kipferlia bialata TaxID=797122 RepID=A0A9K3CM83_9EUKA|nr:hypothetical protein KIPB_000375 [Kipferlia bialata]|eukprot:g375.t1